MTNKEILAELKRSYEYLRDPDKWKPHQERYAKAEQNAQNALNEIRKRKL